MMLGTLRPNDSVIDLIFCLLRHKVCENHIKVYAVTGIASDNSSYEAFD